MFKIRKSKLVTWYPEHDHWYWQCEQCQITHYYRTFKETCYGLRIHWLSRHYTGGEF